jgi:hypothetical protein
MLASNTQSLCCALIWQGIEKGMSPKLNPDPCSERPAQGRRPSLSSRLDSREDTSGGAGCENFLASPPSQYRTAAINAGTQDNGLGRS